VKIHFDGVNLNSSSGPNTFASRLAKKLFEMGHACQFDGKDADVSLVFIEPSGMPLAPCVVQRLDGIWFRPQDFLTKNVGIKGLYEKAGAVVFQSLFDYDMVIKHWGTPGAGPQGFRTARSTIIGNGIELSPVKELTIPRLIEMRAAYDQIFVCSSNWHAQKRLVANVQLFDHLRNVQFPNSCLIVIGDHPDHRATGPHVFYAGGVGPETYMQIYSAANWMLHLAWADHCPNVVIEALSQGTPVVCSEVGGTKELIGHGAYGMVLKENEPYDFELYDYDNPPTIDVSQVTSLPTRHQLDYAGIPNIDINHVASRYIELFNSLFKR
jgi:glycosyltransferase involved in cell wall biosynthesis